MAFNKRVDRLESGPNNPKSPNDEVIWVDTENNSIKRYNESNSSWVSVGGSGGNANVADFEFSLNEDEGTTSSMTIANHDMVIETTRTGGQDADISITSADDIWITAGDEIEIDAGDTIEISSDADHVRIVSDRTINNNEWTFETNGGLRFPDSTVQTTAYTGGGSASFTVPTAFKDSDGDDLITFEITNTGTARIGTPQDDLSLRSARDITLFAGDDGPGNVYIGWGDATYTPDSPNRVATIGDIESVNTGDITFVDNTISSDTGDDIVIQSKDEDGIVKASIRLDQSNEQVLIEAIDEDNDSFNDTQWSTAVWTGSTVLITNTPDIISFFNTVLGNVTRVSINDGSPVTYEGASFGDGAATINVGGTPVAEEDPLTVTQIRFYYELVSEINIDYDDSEFNIISRGMSMTIDSSGELDLKARESDLHLYASDDVRFTTNWDNSGTEHSWRMSENGRFELPGAGYIQNPVNSSGDGGNNDTIKIVPDSGLIEQQYHEDQYLIIDPTDPNHIHIRAGGSIDESTSDLIIGGEKTNLIVSDSTGEVVITVNPPSESFTYENIEPEATGNLYISGTNTDILIGDYLDDSQQGGRFVVTNISEQGGNTVVSAVIAGTGTIYAFSPLQSYTFYRDPNFTLDWTFERNGILAGPYGGVLPVYGISSNEPGAMPINSGDKIVLISENGEFLNDANIPSNQIATIGDIGDISYIRTSVPTSSIGVEGDVEGMVADDGNFHYYCAGDYDGTNHVWKRVGWTAGTWGV
jgi:hypothetical protein